MATIGTKLYIWLFSKFVGQDEFGNKYYIDKRTDFEGKHKRFVIYNGIDEPSKVPPMWHSWLHYVSDEIPSKITTYDWQKKHLPNLTGTEFAYYPSGHPNSSNKAKSNLKTTIYEPWQPE